MLQKKRFKNGFTLVELMVVVVIISTLAVIGFSRGRQILVRSALVSDAVRMKNIILNAKLRASEWTAPVMVRFEADESLLILIDRDRNGIYGEFGGGDNNEELVHGIDVNTGRVFSNRNVQLARNNDEHIILPAEHPSGVYSVIAENGVYTTFIGDAFRITPSGMLRNELDDRPAKGAIFLKTEGGEMTAMIHITELGEIRVAIRSDSDTEWVWQ